MRDAKQRRVPRCELFVDGARLTLVVQIDEGPRVVVQTVDCDFVDFDARDAEEMAREQALGIAGGCVASELRQSVANALGVDDLPFDTGSGGLRGARVSVAKTSPTTSS